eukprot:148213-Chlamydomonas_euryale.AAC.1
MTPLRGAQGTRCNILRVCRPLGAVYAVLESRFKTTLLCIRIPEINYFSLSGTVSLASRTHYCTGKAKYYYGNSGIRRCRSSTNTPISMSASTSISSSSSIYTQ